MATHDRAAVDRMQRRVVEMVGGQVVRDEAEGTYETHAPVSVISGHLPDDSAHRDEHPLEDEGLAERWEGVPAERSPVEGERAAAGETAAADDIAAPAAAAGDVLEEDLIDEREAQQVRDEDLFTDEAFSDDAFSPEPFPETPLPEQSEGERR